MGKMFCEKCWSDEHTKLIKHRWFCNFCFEFIPTVRIVKEV